MALQKNIELENGVTISYSRIKTLEKNIDKSRGLESIVSIEHFLTSDTSKKPVEISEEFVKIVYSFTDAYIELKKLPRFIDSIDC